MSKPMTDQVSVTQAVVSFSRATGRPLPKLSSSDQERFWDHVQKGDSCWQWTGSASGNATHKYGDLCIGGVSYRAHRISYALRHGVIPSGMVIDHLCRNPLCVNPSHLEAVTPAENTRRGKSYPTHCKRGHPLSGENVRWVGRQRRCRSCQRVRTNKWRAKTNG